MLPIIMYHAVGEDSLGRFNIEIEAFKKQISYLANNYEVIRLKDIEIELRFQKNSDKKKIAITFDDAFMNVYQNAHKILDETDGCNYDE